MNQKILFLKGLPGSGKSTYAKELVAKDPDRWVRVNKDDIRLMHHDRKWSRGREATVEQTQYAIAKAALDRGQSVIVDNTHMSPRHEGQWAYLAKENGAEFEVKEFDTSIEDCIKRDQERGIVAGCVGKDVIHRMFYQHMCEEIQKNPSLPDCYIVDIDGTLALMHDRGPFEWGKVGNDLPNTSLIRLIDALQAKGEVSIILLSGRDGICQDETIKWLLDNGVTYNHLYMRDAGNTEKDTIIKRRLYDEHVAGKYNVEAVFDDRPCMVRMWRQMGLFCFDCGNGIEF